MARTSSSSHRRGDREDRRIERDRDHISWPADVKSTTPGRRRGGSGWCANPTVVEPAPDEAYSLRSRTFVLWDDGRDRLWGYSGDVGTTFWDRDTAGTWTATPWFESGRVAPAFLRSAVPERFG